MNKNTNKSLSDIALKIFEVRNVGELKEFISYLPEDMRIKFFPNESGEEHYLYFGRVGIECNDYPFTKKGEEVAVFNALSKEKLEKSNIDWDN